MTQPADHIRYLWQKLPTDAVVVTAEEMRARAGKFQNRIRRRNIIEYIATAIAIAGFGYHLVWRVDTWEARGVMALLIAGCVVSVWNLHRRGRAVATPRGFSTIALVDFQRAELTRQRDALRTAWRWYLLPVAPGIAAFLVLGWMGGLLADGVPVERAQIGAISLGIVTVLVCTAVTLYQFLGAAHLQRRIEDLDRYRES